MYYLLVTRLLENLLCLLSEELEVVLTLLLLVKTNSLILLTLLL
jgi:hypothetical protein